MVEKNTAIQAFIVPLDLAWGEISTSVSPCFIHVTSKGPVGSVQDHQDHHMDHCCLCTRMSTSLRHRSTDECMSSYRMFFFFFTKMLLHNREGEIMLQRFSSSTWLLADYTACTLKKNFLKDLLASTKSIV